MSDIIQLLPDSVANQIAAGEVIQRPASVIKELVENAIDAGATQVNILVVDAGRTSIQVIDNGKGMSETDARMAFERHATSKITSASDLFSLHTMGFRGEALASVAAVAQVELKTRQPSSDIGTHLSIAASKVTGQEPCSCAVGSNFTVENLFYNVPARRKFLKANSTELKNIITAFERIALVYPDVAFNLYSNETELYALKASGLRQRIVDVAGKRINPMLIPIGTDTSLCNIKGFIGKPESAKKKAQGQYFFVNGRYMKHPFFHKMVLNAYNRLIPEGEQVPYFIYFDVPAENIDVNIHPTKTEIKFENEQDIAQILSATVKESIGMFSQVATIDFDTQGCPDIPVFDPNDTIQAPKVEYNPAYNPFNETPATAFTPADLPLPPSEGSAPKAENRHLTENGGTETPAAGNTPDRQSRQALLTGQLYEGLRTAAPHGQGLFAPDEINSADGGFFTPSASAVTPASSRNPSPQAPGSADAPSFANEIPGPGASAQKPVTPDAQAPEEQDELESAIQGRPAQATPGGQTLAAQGQPAAVQGASSAVQGSEQATSHYQYKGRYIMTAVKSGLMIIDQHRAHMRICYEQYLDQVSQRKGQPQKMLFPEMLHLNAGERLSLEKVMPELEALGFELTPMGGDAYAVNAMPSGINGVKADALLHDLIASAEECTSSVVDDINRQLALGLARHAAIPYGTPLGNAEMESIVNQLFSCSNFNYTPDGKSIMAILRQTEIEHLLG